MIQVECQSIGIGKCVWCGKEKEVLTVAFTDHSIVGAMCMPDFCKALRMKLLTATAIPDQNSGTNHRSAKSSA
jgi:hypothetical protein